MLDKNGKILEVGDVVRCMPPYYKTFRYTSVIIEAAQNYVTINSSGISSTERWNCGDYDYVIDDSMKIYKISDKRAFLWKLEH